MIRLNLSSLIKQYLSCACFSWSYISDSQIVNLKPSEHFIGLLHNLYWWGVKWPFKQHYVESGALGQDPEDEQCCLGLGKTSMVLKHRWPCQINGIIDNVKGQNLRLNEVKSKTKSKCRPRLFSNKGCTWFIPEPWLVYTKTIPVSASVAHKLNGCQFIPALTKGQFTDLALDLGRMWKTKWWSPGCWHRKKNYKCKSTLLPFFFF